MCPYYFNFWEWSYWQTLLAIAPLPTMTVFPHSEPFLKIFISTILWLSVAPDAEIKVFLGAGKLTL